MRDAKITQLYEGTQQIQRLVIARALLGKERRADRGREVTRSVRIVVLMKPVPDPASGGERLGPDGRLDRAAVPGRRQRQRRVRARGGPQARRGGQGGEVDPRSRWRRRTRPRRCARRWRWAPRSGVLVTDPALEGSCAVSTARVLAAALETLEFDLVLRRRRHLRRGRRRRAGRRRGPAAAAVPVVRGQDRARRGGRHRPRPAHQRRPATTCSRRRCPRSSPARRPSASRATRRSRGSWPPARKDDRRPCRWRDLGIDGAAVGGWPWRRPRSSTRGRPRPGPPRGSSARRPTRPPGRSSRSSPSGRLHLMAGGICVDRRGDRRRHLANISAEVATLARSVAAEGGRRSRGSSSRPIRSRRPRSSPATCRAS